MAKTPFKIYGEIGLEQLELDFLDAAHEAGELWALIRRRLTGVWRPKETSQAGKALALLREARKPLGWKELRTVCGQTFLCRLIDRGLIFRVQNELYALATVDRREGEKYIETKLSS